MRSRHPCPHPAGSALTGAGAAVPPKPRATVTSRRSALPGLATEHSAALAVASVWGARRREGWCGMHSVLVLPGPRDPCRLTGPPPPDPCSRVVSPRPSPPPSSGPCSCQTFSGLWAPGPGLRVLSPGGSTRAAMVYCGALNLVTWTLVWR